MAKVGFRSLGFAILLAAIGCSERPAGRSAFVRANETDSAGVALVTMIGRPSALPEWTLSTQLAELSGNAEPFVGSVGQVGFLSDGRLLVADSQADALYLVEPDARAFRLVGGSGDGPGEFRDITTLTITSGDTAFVYDRRLSRVTVLSPSGELISTVQVGDELVGVSRLAGLWAIDSDRLVVHGVGPSDTVGNGQVWKDPRESLLFPLDGRGQALSSPVRFTGGYRILVPGVIVAAPFANEPIVAVGSRRVVHGSGLTYELFVRSPALQLERVIRWSDWRVPLDDAAIASARTRAEASFERTRQSNPELVDVVLEAMFVPDLLPDSLPALSSVLVDPSERLWVSRYVPSAEAWNQGDAWHILAPTGEPLARVALPGRSRLAAVGQDRVALILRDELDVEHLKVFQLEHEPDR